MVVLPAMESTSTSAGSRWACRTGLVQQSFQGLEDLMLQKGELPLQRRADAAHYVRGHGGLGIEHGGLAQGFAGGKLQQAGGQGGGADIYGQAQAAGHGSKGAEGCFAGKLDAGVFRGLRQGDLSVAQEGRLAGRDAHPRPLRRRWAGRDSRRLLRRICRTCPGRRRGAARESRAPPADPPKWACPQRTGGCRRFPGARLIHASSFSRKSTMPKKVTVFWPLIYFRSVSLVVLYTSTP